MKPLLLLQMISALFLSFASPQEQAERLFDNAQTFMNAQKYNEALTDLQTVVDQYGQTAWAPKALLELGNYYLHIEQSFEKARSIFARIQKDYPASEEAPAAYYFKALIVEREGDQPSELEAAMADLIRMISLYPDNQWLNGSFFLFGKLAMRLTNFAQSLSYFHRLELNFPNSEYLPKALLLSAKAAYSLGEVDQAIMILARLESKFPNSEEFKLASAYLRLLDRFRHSNPGYDLDANFFGATPKQFQNPKDVWVSENGIVGIMDQRGALFATLSPFAQLNSIASKDLVGFGEDPRSGILVIYESRITNREGMLLPTLSYPNGTVREIKSAAVDAYGRMLVIDGNAKDLLVFDERGGFQKNLGLSRPRLVRCFQNEIWVLANDGDTLNIFGAGLNFKGTGPGGLSSIVDFKFDPFGNLYVLADKGNQVAIFTQHGHKHEDLNLKSGTYPLKQAQAIGVDSSGAIYLADRRSGAVFRFQ